MTNNATPNGGQAQPIGSRELGLLLQRVRSRAQVDTGVVADFADTSVQIIDDIEFGVAAPTWRVLEAYFDLVPDEDALRGQVGELFRGSAEPAGASDQAGTGLAKVEAEFEALYLRNYRKDIEHPDNFSAPAPRLDAETEQAEAIRSRVAEARRLSGRIAPPMEPRTNVATWPRPESVRSVEQFRAAMMAIKKAVGVSFRDLELRATAAGYPVAFTTIRSHCVPAKSPKDLRLPKDQHLMGMLTAFGAPPPLIDDWITVRQTLAQLPAGEIVAADPAEPGQHPPGLPPAPRHPAMLERGGGPCTPMAQAATAPPAAGLPARLPVTSPARSRSTRANVLWGLGGLLAVLVLSMRW
ncbi:hypothetical protein M8C13_18765 [Crossiella sp. SN42]|uniref:hypothetical protein n=1 Tax=Crossiella sp. SN42 TaxID=2944808 RepID=UPI00207C37C1|nr:hypothetical protein [Crossiella sp. SN42]MCO1577801.1 hypothetical protein [Crossiella sp. SN42]